MFVALQPITYTYLTTIVWDFKAVGDFICIVIDAEVEGIELNLLLFPFNKLETRHFRHFRERKEYLYFCDLI